MSVYLSICILFYGQHMLLLVMYNSPPPIYRTIGFIPPPHTPTSSPLQAAATSHHHIMSEKRNLNYEKDERVLCYHGPLLYEAKVSQLTINTPLGPNMVIDTQDCTNTYDRLSEWSQKTIDPCTLFITRAGSRRMFLKYSHCPWQPHTILLILHSTRHIYTHAHTFTIFSISMDS